MKVALQRACQVFPEHADRPGWGFELVMRRKLDSKEIGAALKRLRMEAGVSLAEMADRLGMAYQNLSRLEHGRQEPMLSTINKYLRMLGFELVIAGRPQPKAGLKDEAANDGGPSSPSRTKKRKPLPDA